MLSKKQSKIIESLTKEFDKINIPITTNGLINISGITEEYNALQQAKHERNIERGVWEKARFIEAKRIANLLNAELESIGLSASVPSNLRDNIKITIAEKYGRICYTKEISIMLENRMTDFTDEFGDRNIVGIDYTFYPRTSTYGGREHFSTIDELTSHVKFEGQIKFLYSLTK